MDLLSRATPEPNTGCYLWDGSLNELGYGRVGARPYAYSHRKSYEIYKGTIPKGMLVLHKCDTPCCINPDHLWLGSQSDNIRDCVAKNRHHEAKKEFCVKGHQYTEENTRKTSKGHRQCRICKKAARRRFFERNGR